MRMTTEFLAQFADRHQIRIFDEGFDVFHQGEAISINFRRSGVSHEFKIEFAWLARCHVGEGWHKADTVLNCGTTRTLTYLIEGAISELLGPPREGMRLLAMPRNHIVTILPKGDARELDVTKLPRAAA